MYTDIQPLVMALERSCSRNYQSHQTLSNGRKSETKNQKRISTVRLLVHTPSMHMPCTHIQNFTLNSSFTKRVRCQRYFLYTNWLCERAQQNKGGIFGEAICQIKCLRVSEHLILPLSLIIQESYCFSQLVQPMLPKLFLLPRSRTVTVGES